MSVQTEIDRIAQNVANTYAVLEALGADMPDEQTSDNLPATAGSAKTLLYSEQSLTEDQQEQARTNISAARTTPTLSTAQQKAIAQLTTNYHNNMTYKGLIKYTSDLTRNVLADNGCFNSSGALKSNCSLFAQLIWAGISQATFVGNSETYDGTVTKYFDWGYYFQFPTRAAYGLAKTDSSGEITGYYGFVQPNEDSYEGSYSINTLYTGSDNLYGQTFRTYMYAADMAHELSLLGCEVPLSEVMTGDLVFLKGRKNNDNQELLEDLVFRGIDHVAVVTAVNDVASGDISFYECSPYYGSSAGLAKLSASANANIVRAAEIFDRIVMVARHPAAFGLGGNVPSQIVAI